MALEAVGFPPHLHLNRDNTNRIPSRVDVKIQPKPEKGEGLRSGLFVARDSKWRKQRLRGRFPLRNYARVLD